jgi:hypothetical protein
MKTSNFVSKNNIGAATSLFLVILLSQARVFNFLLDTALGRAILILFILVISYTNQILGVVSILFIIIMLNNSDIGYLEGFDTPTDSSSTGVSGSNIAAKQSNKVTAPVASKVAEKVAATSPAPPDVDAPIIPTTTTSTTEGFNTLDNERNIQKGKSSNSISVSSSMRESTGIIEPFDGGALFGNYGLY